VRTNAVISISVLTTTSKCGGCPPNLKFRPPPRLIFDFPNRPKPQPPQPSKRKNVLTASNHRRSYPSRNKKQTKAKVPDNRNLFRFRLTEFCLTLPRVGDRRLPNPTLPICSFIEHTRRVETMTTIPARLARATKTSSGPTDARQRVLSLYRDWYRSVSFHQPHSTVTLPTHNTTPRLQKYAPSTLSMSPQHTSVTSSAKGSNVTVPSQTQRSSTFSSPKTVWNTKKP